LEDGVCYALGRIGRAAALAVDVVYGLGEDGGDGLVDVVSVGMTLREKKRESSGREYWM